MTGMDTATAADPSADALIAAATAHHRDGRLAEAEKLYRQTLAIAPRHAETLYHLGIIGLQTGRPLVAIEAIGEAVKIDTSNAEFEYHLALAYQMCGRADEALQHYTRAVHLKADYAEAHTNLANILVQRGQLPQAAEHYRIVLRLKPDSVETHYNLGNVLAQQGDMPDAVAHFQRCIAQQPGFAEAHTNLGLALSSQGKLEDAAACHRHALALKPSLAEAHANLGSVLKEMGRLEEAEAALRRAVAIRPSFAQAHHNLGLVLTALGRTDQAKPHLQQASKSQPKLVDTHKALARSLLAGGNPEQAIEPAMQALAIQDSAETRILFVDALLASRSMPEIPGLRDCVTRVLVERWRRPAALFHVAWSLVTQNDAIRDALQRATHAAARFPGDLLGEAGLAALAADPLFRSLLQSAQMSGVPTERLLTDARSMLLSEASAGGTADADRLTFYAALAEQCFINSYVFHATTDELSAVEKLASTLDHALRTGGSVSILALVAVAAHRPLASLPHASALLNSSLSASWPASVRSLLERQVANPLEERRLAQTIPALTEIGTGNSQAVREQYEESPYPVWVATSLSPGQRDIHAELASKFPLVTIRPLRKNGPTDVLIAGCGTGQQVAELASFHRNASILAIDLSLASLSYAKRQTALLKLDNIEYAQADILKLDTIGRTFDVIVSTGVLHHLTDPMAGLRTLLKLLRPDGFMWLAFYSETARRDIVAAQDYAAAQGYRATPSDIRRFRQDIINLDETSPLKSVTGLPDFFSTSECRDLLFHVQEHRFSLPQIESLLAAHDLEFLGFEIPPAVRRDYAAAFPDDRAMTNLTHWHAFETEHPQTFLGMYQFWVQKRG